MSASPLPMSTKSFEEQELEADALAALNLVNSPDPETAPSKPPAPVAPASPPSSGSDNGGLRQYQSRSSFAPNSKSMERIANAEAQYAAKQESRSKPGRAKAKQGGKGRNAWGSSDEEEEDDDDESDEEKSPVAKDSQKSTAILSPQPQPHPTHPNNISELSHVGNQYGSESRSGPSRRLPAIPNAGTGPSGQQPTPEPPRNQDYRSAHGHGQDYRSAHGHGQDYRSAHGHNSRPSSSDPHAHRRQPTEQLDEFGRRVAADPGPRQSQAQTLPNRPMWSTVLDPHGEAQKPTNAKDTFIQIEPNETMTMAFTPQGLLQAGMQDKQSRSAKQQEAHARETGASLINVPSAPPPPQMGLVGAITAHQRDREREGGVGAALTERERERRVAEERQRKYDELQRQQLDKAMTPGGGNMDMQQGFNPMMMHPMMWGMPPMMYPNMGWGGGMTPQQQQQQQYQMWAAQQAAMQAYQQTMINLSQAGSQAPSEAGGTPETGMPRSASPMGGWGMGNMPMGSPMMSPMMMPGMMPNMGMMPGMMPGFGMGGVGGSGFMQSPQPPRSPMNDDAARISLAHSNQDSPQTRSLDPSKPASRENYAS